MIDIENKILFVHVPKTAGTSVNNAIFVNNPLEPKRKSFWTNHNTLEEYRLKHPKLSLEKFFKFTIVRNPWDRLVSDYFHYKEQPLVRRGNVISARDVAVQRYMPRSFEEFVENNYYPISKFKPGRLRPQLDYLTLNGVVDMNFIARFENLEQDFKYIVEMVEKHGAKLPKIRASRHRHYTEYYNEKTKALVAETYKEDISYFGYKFGA